MLGELNQGVFNQLQETIKRGNFGISVEKKEGGIAFRFKNGWRLEVEVGNSNSMEETVKILETGLIKGKVKVLDASCRDVTDEVYLFLFDNLKPKEEEFIALDEWVALFDLLVHGGEEKGN